MSLNQIETNKNVLLEDHFELTNGKKIKNIKELKKELKNIDEETHKQHITKKGNEYADWIEEAYGNKKLAKKIRKQDHHHQN